jgi:hypothetical protein
MPFLAKIKDLVEPLQYSINQRFIVLANGEKLEPEKTFKDYNMPPN